MKINRSWWLALGLVALLGGVAPIAPRVAHAQEVQLQASNINALANALIQFETATRWESMQPSWRARRDPWIAHVRSAVTPAQIAALTLELETIMTWEAMYPRWRQERPGWVARCRSAVSEHDVAQLLIALEVATTWNAMYEARWRPVRAAWIARLQAI